MSAPDTEALPLFRALRDLRARLAKEQNVPAYVIFHDSTLREIAERRPDSMHALARVPGIGGAKLARYGEDVLDSVTGPEFRRVQLDPDRRAGDIRRGNTRALPPADDQRGRENTGGGHCDPRQ